MSATSTVSRFRRPLPAPLVGGAALAVALLGAPAAADAQFQRRATGTGDFPGAGAFPDRRFDYAYSFRAEGFAPGSDGAGALSGASGDCYVGQACATRVERGYQTGGSSYSVFVDFGGALLDTPDVYVNGFGDTPGSLLALDAAPVRTLNAFYVLLHAPAGGGRADVDNLIFLSPYTSAAGFGVTAGGSAWALYTFAGDLRDHILGFDLGFGGNTGVESGRPAVELYVGTLPGSVVPEPTTVTLLGIGLAAFALGATRRRRV